MICMNTSEKTILYSTLLILYYENPFEFINILFQIYTFLSIPFILSLFLKRLKKGSTSVIFTSIWITFFSYQTWQLQCDWLHCMVSSRQFRVGIWIHWTIWHSSRWLQGPWKKEDSQSLCKMLCQDCQRQRFHLNDMNSLVSLLFRWKTMVYKIWVTNI